MNQIDFFMEKQGVLVPVPARDRSSSNTFSTNLSGKHVEHHAKLRSDGLPGASRHDRNPAPETIQSPAEQTSGGSCAPPAQTFCPCLVLADTGAPCETGTTGEARESTTKRPTPTGVAERLAIDGHARGGQLFTNQKEGEANETGRTNHITVRNESASALRNNIPYYDRVRETTRGIAANGRSVSDAPKRSDGSGYPNTKLGSNSSKLVFGGSTYIPALDESRLNGQLKRVRNLMSDGSWRSLSEIAEVTGDPEASVSARLRQLRKMGEQVDARRRTQALWEYRLILTEPL